MFLYELPIDSDKRTGGAFEYVSVLDGVTYSFQYTYNTRIDTWFLTLANETETVKVGPLPLLLGNNEMFASYNYSELPQFGDISVNDEAEDSDGATKDVEAGLFNFGDSKTMVYQSIIDP